MSRKVYTPGVGGTPYGNTVANPIGSNYSTDSGYSATNTILLEREIRRAIFDNAPEQYKALRLVFEKPMEEVNLDEFTYLEKTFGRVALEATSSPAAVAAVPGAEVTQVIAMSADSVNRAQPDDVITYPDGTKGIVRLIAALNVTVASMTSQGLPAVVANDVFSIASAIAGDGGSTFSHYDRMETIERYNYVQRFLRARRWTKMELLKYQNAGTTNYLEMDKEDVITQLRVDLFVSYFNGTRGEFKLADGRPAKAMGGILPSMQAAGSMAGTPTTASLQSQFASYALKTNRKKEGGVRFIYGTDEMLWELSKSWKNPIRYEPSERIADLNLEEFRIGTGRYVPVVCELFGEPSAFPATWARKLLVLDQETISPVKMRGLDAFNVEGSTLNKGVNGSREDFQDFYCEANLSQRFNNPLGSFSLDIQ